MPVARLFGVAVELARVGSGRAVVHPVVETVRVVIRVTGVRNSVAIDIECVVEARAGVASVAGPVAWGGRDINCSSCSLVTSA